MNTNSITYTRTVRDLTVEELMIVPRLTTSLRDTLTPVEGTIVYNTSIGDFQGYKAGSWQSFETSTPPAANEWATNGNDVYNTNVGNIMIGISSGATAKLDVTGTLRFRSIGTGALTTDGSGNVSNTTVSSANTAFALMQRDASGNFAASAATLTGLTVSGLSDCILKATSGVISSGTVGLANLASDVTDLIAAKLPLTGGTVTGAMTFTNNITATLGASNTAIFNWGANAGGMHISSTGGPSLFLSDSSQTSYMALNCAAGNNYLINYSSRNFYIKQANVDAFGITAPTGGPYIQAYVELQMNSKKITGLANPASAQDAATKNYVDSGFLPLSGGTLTGTLTVPSSATITHDTLASLNFNKTTGNVAGIFLSGSTLYQNVVTGYDIRLQYAGGDKLLVGSTGVTINDTLTCNYNISTTGDTSINAGSSNYGVVRAKGNVSNSFELTNSAGTINLEMRNDASGVANYLNSVRDHPLYIQYNGGSLLTLNGSGLTAGGALAMGTNRITGLGTPSASTDAATKLYVDSAIGGKVYSWSFLTTSTTPNPFINAYPSNLGANSSLTRNAAGDYTITLTGAFIPATQGIPTASCTDGYIVSCGASSTDTLLISCYATSAITTKTDGAIIYVMMRMP